MNFSECQKHIINRCLALNLSGQTLHKYSIVLKRFQKFLLANSLTCVEEITAHDIRGHLSELYETMDAISVKNHYMALSTFFSYLHREEIIKKNPIDKVIKPKITKKILPAFSKADIHTLLNAFDRSTFLGFRNYTLMCVFFATGARRGAVSRMKIEDMRFDINIVKVTEKGNIQRNLPLTDTLRKVLIKYIKVRSQYIKERGLVESPYLFITNQGARMQENAISNLFCKVAKEVNINGVRVSAHTWRHTFAKFFLLNGGDVFTLQKLLGHSDIKVTKQYIDLNEKEIKIQNDKFNPFENDYWEYY